MRLKPEIKRFVTSLLCVVSVVCCLPLTASATGNFTIWEVSLDSMRYRVNEDGQEYPIYCYDDGIIPPHVDGTIAGRTNYTEQPDIGSEEIQKRVLASLYVGYPNDAAGFDAAYDSGRGEPYDADGKNIATQGAVWLLVDPRLPSYATASNGKNYYNNSTYFNNAAYYNAVFNYAHQGGGYGLGTLTMPTDAQLSKVNGIWRSEVLQASGNFDGVFRITGLPENVKVYDSASNTEITGYLTTATRFYFVYTGTVSGSYASDISYQYKSFVNAYMYYPEKSGNSYNTQMQRMIRMETETNSGSIVLYAGTLPESTVKLTLSKTVEGDMGDINKDFHFTISLTKNNTAVTDEFVCSGAGYTKIVFDENGNASVTLRHGQSLTISGLPSGISYTVTEQEANSAGYITESSNASGNNATSDINIGFTNTKSSVPKTGVVLEILPYVLALIIGIAILIFIIYFRNKSKNDKHRRMR